MFEFSNLGALALGAVFIGALQLGGLTGLEFNEPRVQGAKFVTVSSRRSFDPRMDAGAGLDQFAKQSETESSLFEKVVLVMDRASDAAKDATRTVLVALID